MNFWRAQHQINGQSHYEHQLVVSGERHCAQADRTKDVLSVGVMPNPIDPASNSSSPRVHAASASDLSLFTGSVRVIENNLEDVIDIRDHKLGVQFHLISTKAFQNSLCARHNVQDSVELLSAESDPSLQVGVFAGVGLAHPIQVSHDESSRGLRRVGQLPLRKLKITREKKKEENLQRLKDAGDKVVRTPTTVIIKELASEPSFENNQRVKVGTEASDEQENLRNLLGEEAGHVGEEEVQDEQQESTKNELKKQVKEEPEAPEESVEPSIQLGLSRVVFQPMNFALSRFTEGQRKVIVMIDQMTEESHLVWLGPSAWCEKP